MLGPIQLLAVGFENNERFKGDILNELDEIRSRGLIRLLDMLFVMKDEEGNILTLEDTDLTPEEEVELGNLIESMLGLKEKNTGTIENDIAVENSYGLAIKDILDVVDRIEPGTSAGILLIEHVWASGLKHAIVEAGGHVLAQGFLSSDVTLMIGKEAEAIAEAEAAIELSEAVKGAALLDILSTIDTAEELKEAVIEGTSKTASEMQLVKTAAVAEAVRNLVVAGIIDESETIEAIEALVKAGLMDTSALDIAESATEAEA